MRYILNVDKQIKATDDVLSKIIDFPLYVAFNGEVTDESAKKFVEELEAAENAALKAGQEILPITINSPGGGIAAGLSMIDAIESCSLPIATIAIGEVMSFGASLFVCGAEGHRYIAPHARVMLHTAAGGMVGKSEDIQVSAAEINRMNKKMIQMLAKKCGHEYKDYFWDILMKDKHNSNWYMDAEEAVKHNIANKIHLPSFKVNLKLTHKFG
jgi:ATP-dependent Clp protease protease subunit